MSTFGDIVYHGTFDLHIPTLVEGINLKKGSKIVDFGQGFYTTFDFNQARSWAKKRADRYNQQAFTPEDFATPVVLEYVVDLKKLAFLKGKIFDVPNIEWAEFIYYNRSKLNRFKVFHSHDYICGPVADGKTDELIYKLDNGIIDMETFWKSIEFKGKNNQISFHTESTIICLTLRDEVRHNGKRISLGTK